MDGEEAKAFGSRAFFDDVSGTIRVPCRPEARDYEPLTDSPPLIAFPFLRLSLSADLVVFPVIIMKQYRCL